MKKILFSLVALVCSMSMNAQVMKIMKGNTVVAEYLAEQADNVVFEAIPLGTAYAQRTGGIYVKCVQLWENGPRFAVYNVGAANNNPEDFGGYYCWGKNTDQDQKQSFKGGESALTGTDDTATNLWGSNWRMPTQQELQNLCDESYCTKTWKTVNGKSGYEFKGKTGTAYENNSLFLPAAGRFDGSNVGRVGDEGYYWCSSPSGSGNAECLLFFSGYANVSYNLRGYGFSVRAVLAE